VKKQIVVFLGITHCFFAVYAQGEIDLQPRVLYRNEWSLAAMLNSNGFGANYRYGKRLNADNKHLFEVDFAYFKDPKERKSLSQTTTGARYVEGKKNLAFDFRFGYGKQHEIYRKHDAGGVAIRRFYNVGPSLILLKPIYYEVADPEGPDSRYLIQRPQPEKYDAYWQNVYILSRASFFKGFKEISVLPGAFAKFGFNFEFGNQDRIIHALEAGLIAEGFIQKVEIMDFNNPHISQSKVAQNQQFFLTNFINKRIGKSLHPYKIKKKRKRSREIS
jgi:hypothetical protein